MLVGKQKAGDFLITQFFLQLFMLSYQQVLRIVHFLILVQIEKNYYVMLTQPTTTKMVLYNIGIFVQCEI